MKRKRLLALFFLSFGLLLTAYCATNQVISTNHSSYTPTVQGAHIADPSFDFQILPLTLGPDRRVIFPQLGPIPHPDIPAGTILNDFVPLLPEELARGEREAQYFSGVGTWFRETWNEHTGLPEIYRGTKGEPFVAMVDKVSYMKDQNGWFLLCLLNFEQIPCSAEKTVQYIPNDARSSFLLQTPPLTQGLYQANLVSLADYDDRSVEHWILEGGVHSDGPYFVAVGGNTQIPDTPYVVPTQTREPFGLNLRMVDLHTKNYPLASDGTSYHSVEEAMITKPDQKLHFFLHLNNPYSISYDYAVVAIMDRRQVVPIYLAGEKYSPLYVRNKFHTWQTLEVDLIAPSDFGPHTLQILSFPFPYIPRASKQALEHQDWTSEILIGEADPGTLINLDVRQGP